MCPLKEAAIDAPNLIAVIGKDFSLTYKELDEHVDKVGEKSPLLFAQMFAKWRKDSFFFPVNPRIPNPPKVENAPPKTLLIRTSGSTSTPKIAILTQKSLLANAIEAILALDLKPQDQWKLTLPLYHVGGIGIVLRSILARATIVLDDSPDITHLSFVPTQLYRFSPVYKNLKCILVGGAPIPSYPFPIHTTYGLTEMGSMVTLDGHLLKNRELKIDDKKEIWVKGATLFQGYLNEKTIDGWFPTKDLGEIKDGKLLILGRKDWMFISGGENIQPEEIENHLISFPEILEAAVVAKEDQEYGKRPVAFIVSIKPISKDEINKKLSLKLPKYKIPIEIHFIEKIPQKNNLKIDRLFLSQLINDK